MAWLEGWNNRLEYLVDHERIGEDFDDFPVRVVVASGTGRTNFDATAVFDELSTSGTEYKIAITDYTGIVQLPVEIEYWDLGTEKAFLWTSIPNVASGTDTKIYLYYDKDQPDNDVWVGEIGSNAGRQVWNSNYKFVHHMANAPAGSDSMIDSTSNNFDGTTAVLTSNSLEIDDALGPNINFTAANSSINYGDILDSVFSSNDYTVETMSHSPDWDYHGDQGMILQKWNTSGGNDNAFNMRSNRFYTDGDSSTEVGIYGNAIEGDTTYMAGVMDNDVGYYRQDNVSYGSDSSMRSYTSTKDLMAGILHNNVYDFYGNIYELRISDIPLSKAWTDATYYTLHDNLMTVAAGGTAPPPTVEQPWGEDWANFYKLTIESDVIDQTLANFPTLVTLGSGVGLNDFDATDIFGHLEDNSGLDGYTEFMLSPEGDLSETRNTIQWFDSPAITTISGISCISLNGSSQYVLVWDSADLILAVDDFTMEAWVNMPSITSNMSIMSHYTDDTNRWIWQFTDDNRMSFFNDTTAYYSSDFVMPVNEWTHIALVRFDDVLYYFVAGTLVGTRPFSSNIPDRTDYLRLGTRYYSAANGVYFEGYMTKARYSVGIGRYIGSEGVYALSGANMSVSDATYGVAGDLVDGNSMGTFWEDDTSPYPAWCKYDFGSGNAEVVDGYTLYAGAAEMTRMPKTWTFQGSDNDSDWDTLDTQTDETSWTALEGRMYTFSNSTAYRYYRLYATVGNNASIIRLYEWALMRTVSFTPPEQPQNDSYTKLLYYFKGDASSSSHDLITLGSPYVLTETPLFDATAYWYFGGSGAITIADHADWDFGSGDFTVELWFKLSTLATWRNLINKRATTALYRWLGVGIDASGNLSSSVTNDGSSWAFNTGSLDLDIVAGEWYHFAIARENNTIRVFLNGLNVYSDTFTGSVYTDTAAITIGAGAVNLGSPFVGNIFGVRVSKGIARYTDHFTPHNPPNGTSFSNRKKIQLADVDHNKLYTELENWDHVNRQASLWVGVPAVASGVDTVLYLYYDITQGDNDLYVGDTTSSPALKVWQNADYDVVYHMHQFPQGAYMQSSTGANHSVPYNLRVGSLVDGLTGKSYFFPGGADDDYLDLTFNFGNVWTAEVFAYNNFDVSLYPQIFGQEKYISWSMRPDLAQTLYLGGGAWDAGWIDSDTTPPEDEWFYAAVTDNAGTIAYRLNDVADGGGFYVTRSVNTQFHIGQRDGQGSTYYFDGRMQEFRIATEIKSDAWLKATNHTLHGTLITYEQGTRPVYTASGTVTADGLLKGDIPVRLYRRSTGELVGSTFSDGDGLFTVDSIFNEEHYITALYTASGTNALVHDWITP